MVDWGRRVVIFYYTNFYKGLCNCFYMDDIISYDNSPPPTYGEIYPCPEASPDYTLNLPKSKPTKEEGRLGKILLKFKELFSKK